MSIVINVVKESSERNIIDQLEKDHGQVCSQVDVLGGELYMIDELLEQLKSYDSSVTEDELRYHELLGDSLARKLDSLKNDMGMLLRSLAVVRNDIETRFSECEVKAMKLEKEMEELMDQEEEEDEDITDESDESDESEKMWTSENNRFWDSQERDNTWSTENEMWSV